MITRFLVIVNVIAFIWEIMIGGPGILSLSGGNGIVKVYELGAIIPPAVLQDHQWWRVITSGFLHANIAHIAVNMISLYSLGRFIESVLGSLRMLLIYMLSLIVGGLAVVFLSGPDGGTLGASGAIFGLFGALFAIGLKAGKPGMDLVRSNLGILILNLVITFAVPNISWQDHIAGMLCGFVLTYLLYFPPRRVAPVVADANTGTAYETEYQAPPRQ